MTKLELDEGWRLTTEMQAVEEALRKIDNSINFGTSGCRNDEVLKKVERSLRQDAHDLLNVELEQLKQQFKDL